MKKSELRKIIREEIQKLTEAKIFKPGTYTAQNSLDSKDDAGVSYNIKSGDKIELSSHNDDHDTYSIKHKGSQYIIYRETIEYLINK